MRFLIDDYINLSAKDKLDSLLQHLPMQKLTDWELEFLATLKEQGWISCKQEDILDNIYAKFCN